MPGPELRLHTIRRAFQSFRDTPGRRGQVVSLDDADEVLVAGDLHGNQENFRRLLQLADLARAPRRHLVLQPTFREWPPRFAVFKLEKERGEKIPNKTPMRILVLSSTPLGTYKWLGQSAVRQRRGAGVAAVRPG